MSMFVLYSYLHVYIYIYAPGPATPPPPPWDGSHILPLYEIFPLPPLWCGGGVVLSLSPLVVWWGCGSVPLHVVGVWYCPLPRLPPCGVVGVWYGMLGMYGVYGRSGMVCLESMVCLVCMVGMLCMA